MKINRDYISSAVFFVGGFLIGWYGHKAYVRSLEEDAAVSKKETESNTSEKAEPEEKEDKEPEETTEEEEAEDIAKRNNYIQYRKEDPVPRDDYRNGPFIITEEEYEDNLIQDKISVTLYSDGTVAEDGGEVIEDVDATLGLDNIEKAKDGETIYIRNENLGADFELMRVGGTYEEVILGIEEE